MTDQLFLPIHHKKLPESIFGGFEKRDLNPGDGPVEISESLSGKLLLQKLIASRFEIQAPEIITKKYEKPRVYYNGNEISVSFSHTPGAVSGAISKEYIVGLDMESLNRNVHPRLTSRMKHPREEDALYSGDSTLRIWTLKEAALKAIGTGLRVPMNSVCLKKESEDEYSVEFNDGKEAKICSFQESNQWISICYYKSSTSP